MFEYITSDWNFFFAFLSDMGTFIICVTALYGVIRWKKQIWLLQKIEVINDSMKNREICYNATAPLANTLEQCFIPYLNGYEIDFLTMDFTLMRRRISKLIENDNNIEEIKNAILQLKILGSGLINQR